MQTDLPVARLRTAQLAQYFDCRANNAEAELCKQFRRARIE